MNILAQLISTIFLSSTSSLAQDLINLGNQCTCEQLTSLYDCQYFSKCEFVNQVCYQKTCEQMNVEACLSSDCAWNNGKCSKFTNCQDYYASNDEDCSNLRHDCTYNNLTKTCKLKDENTKSCSELDGADCISGIDGKCIYKDNKCQIWTNCEDAEYGHCTYGKNHCIWNIQTNKCVSASSCKHIGDQLCLFAFPHMNQIDAYICQYAQNGSCQDFDTSNQNQETCISQSYGYYQWINGKCTACQSINFDLIKSLSVLTFLLLI
ncbi:unnamed protein product [Paramecium octaurelia]|uniref:Transmembrane protein n=1 Tax=Paramecium octaurelia TaxID=43137 RepID=A0A8S1WPA7_PAROT|nr:unnamed protein product [Paramecium octaurelia]